MILEGKVALITGAGSSIAMMDVEANSLAQSVSDVQECAGDDAAIGIVGNISKWPDAQRAVEETIDGLGGLHILINNAGVRSYGDTATGDGAFWRLTPEEWARVIDINVNGTFQMTLASIQCMREQGWGRIIGVTTSLDTMIRGANLPYGASKAAHEAFMAAIAQELAGSGVTANVLVPGGATNTNFLPGNTDYDRALLIQPDVMRSPVVWLCSEGANTFNGQRVIATAWDDSMPIDQCLAQASSPAAWPQLGRQPIG